MVIKDGAKMSKSMGNVVPAEEMMDRFGADTARIFILFASPPEKELEWSDKGVEGSFRFLSRVHRMVSENLDIFPTSAREAGSHQSDDIRALIQAVHRFTGKVTEDIEKRFQFNTALSAIMELVNETGRFVSSGGLEVEGGREEAARAMEAVIRLLAPFAPHLAEELWEMIGYEESVFLSPWPEFDPELAVSDMVELVVQINGKVRARFEASPDTPGEELKTQALDLPRIQELLMDKEVVKVVTVPGRLVSIVVK
jgi:leucyl-tRNA synthetase